MNWSFNTPDGKREGREPFVNLDNPVPEVCADAIATHSNGARLYMIHEWKDSYFCFHKVWKGHTSVWHCEAIEIADHWMPDGVSDLYNFALKVLNHLNS